MPKPPGNGVDGPIRGHRTRPAAPEAPSPSGVRIERVLRRHVSTEVTNIKRVRICYKDDYFP